MGSMRVVGTPVSEAQLAPLEADCEWLQFGSALRGAEYDAVAALLETRPDVWLRVYFDAPADLGFLRHFPRLRRFMNHAFEAVELDALSHVAELTHLDVDGKRTTYGLDPLLALPQLASVKLEKCKGVPVLASLPSLRAVTLTGCNLGSRAMVWQHVERVQLVQIKGALPEMPSVRRLAINASNMADLLPLAQMQTLRSLELNSVRGFTALPDMSKLTELRRLVIYRASQLTDVSALAALPNLRELELLDVPLSARDVEFLVEMPGLRRCHLELATAAESRAAADLIPAATAGDDHPLAAFTWAESDGAFSLVLWDPSLAPDEFERAGMIENGHSWGAVARRAAKQLGIEGRFELDCEADMFCARGEDAAALQELAQHLIALSEEPNRLLEMLRLE